MTRGMRAIIILLAFFAVAVSGCASTKQYAGFAQAGTTYAAAMDKLLVAAGNVGIDASSEKLLSNDDLSNRTKKDYDAITAVDKERLAIISRLRAHASLLGRYFGLLNELATSDSPKRAEQAIGGVVTGLNSLGTELRGSSIFTNQDIFTSLTNLAVSAMVRGALFEELSRNKDLIQKELKTQEELLRVLSSKIEHDLYEINQIREDRLVIAPLIDPKPISKKDEWISNRRAVLTSEAKIAELSKASGAAVKLREAFEDLVSGKLTLERINILLTDAESLLAVAEAINK